MKERDLLQKLNSLKEIRPDDAWKQSQRDLLLTQISNSAPKELSAWSDFYIVLKNSVKTFSQPAVAFASFVCLLFASAVFGHGWLNSAKPNEVMYQARVISEKVKLNTVIDKDAREKLEVQFAAEHAADIATVLADPEFNTPANETQIAKLSQNFNEELETVKARLTTISSTASNAVIAEKDGDVMSASSDGKEDQGIELFIPPVASSTATSTVATSTASTSQEIINKAQSSFEKKDYQKAAENLKAIDGLIK